MGELAPTLSRHIELEALKIMERDEALKPIAAIEPQLEREFSEEPGPRFEEQRPNGRQGRIVLVLCEDD